MPDARAQSWGPMERLYSPSEVPEIQLYTYGSHERLRWLAKVIYMDSDTSPYLEKEIKNKKRKPHL